VLQLFSDKLTSGRSDKVSPRHIVKSLSACILLKTARFSLDILRAVLCAKFHMPGEFEGWKPAVSRDRSVTSPNHFPVSTGSITVAELRPNMNIVVNRNVQMQGQESKKIHQKMVESTLPVSLAVQNRRLFYSVVFV
jgi:hypothetical protein